MVANPLVPTAYDVIITALWVGVVAYTVVAFVSAVRDRRVTGIRFLLWFLVIVLLPIIGPTAWFVLRDRRGGARTAQRSPAD